MVDVQEDSCSSYLLENVSTGHIFDSVCLSTEEKQEEEKLNLDASSDCLTSPT